MDESLAPGEDVPAAASQEAGEPSEGGAEVIDDVKSRLAELSKKITAAESALEGLRRDLAAIEEEWHSEVSREVSAAADPEAE